MADAVPDPRRALMAKLHIARKQLGLDEATYRAVLRRAAGHDSAADCTEAQLERAAREFKRLGFKPGPARKAEAKPLVRKIHAIWNDMKPMLEDGSDAALRAFVRRQTRGPLHPEGVAAPEFLDAASARAVIEGLKGWRARLERAAREDRADG